MFITAILSETLAPPNIATNGLTGLLTASPKNFNSFWIKYPHTAVSKNSVTPTVEQCALWAVPNASFTNISAKEANSFENVSTFLVSSFLHLVFSNKTTSPSFIASTAALALAPTTSSSLANTTSLSSISLNLLATGANDLDASFPKCEQRITLAPLFIKYCIVGNAPFNLFSSVITPSFSGTLKSHLTKTFLPLTSISSIVFLLKLIDFTS